MDIRSLLLIFFITFFHHAIDAQNLKLCVVESVHTSKRIRALCPQLLIAGNQIDCVIGNDRFDCLRRLTMAKADFTVLEPEDLVAAAAYNEYNILVTSELRLFADEKQRYEMVFIVTEDVRNIWDIKGKRLCHPGLDTTDDWTNAFSTYFEKWIIVRECDPEKTLLGNQMTGLSNFFEAACIAGPWSADTTFDSKLKSKYRNLCAACDNPVGCYSSDKYHGREGALMCLTDNAGDIAWVRLNDTLEHFKDERINKEDYKYVCPDGTTRPVKLEKPCVWITKPWPVVIARSEVAGEVEKVMSSTRTASSGWMLRQLLENYHPTPVSTDTLETPADFLSRFPRFVSANSRATCNPSRRVRWCVSSNLEENKCRWLREASIVYGVEPAISCNQELGRVACLKALKSERADIFIAKPDELLEVKKMGLKTMAQVVPKRNNEFIRIAAVVKQDSWFKSLKDLKGAKACFTGFRDVGWNAFVAAMKNISGAGNYCSDTQAVANFFAESSVFGLNDKDGDMPSQLRAYTKQVNGSGGKDLAAFDCMMSGVGDVAFVDLKSIDSKIGQNRGSQARNRKYRTLCFSEVDTEETCLLTWSPLGAVITHENMTDLRREEIYSMLLEMDKLFGNSFKGETPAFSMYGTYDDSNRSVIFPEEAQHIQMEVHQIQRVSNYPDILNEIMKQGDCSDAGNSNFSNSTIFIYIFIVIVSNLFVA
ncbi:transferrin isoform X1 [Ceratina calcarata]|uniref:Transferrin n=2 Tax=Ceratina calcarata TaxID=156304 RepID=A0AAJ7IWG7_9HYME|nr:transferrin isoform X1 [Ceratina calcarata]XP_017878318.1 transferrin isoform X1 [Ceratina calcarata]